MKFRILSILALIGSLSAQEPVSTPSPVDLSKTGFELRGTPDSLSVSIDDSTYGVTPLTAIGLATGEHSIIFTKKGYYGKKITATAIADSIIPVSAELRAPASLTVITAPDSALLFINRKKIDKTPFTATPLRPETYSIMLLRAGYDQLDTTITLESGASETLRLTMISQKTVESIQTTSPKEIVKDTVQSATPNRNSEVSKQEISEKDPSKKRRFTVIASAIFVAFLSMIFISEFSDSNS